MPTIEIISVDLKTGLNLNLDEYSLAVREGTELISHRDLFQKFLNKYTGTIVHLGNPDMKNWEPESPFFAGLTLDWEFESHKRNPLSYFRFLKNLRNDVDRILRLAMEKSPNKTIFFLTDYQGGRRRKKRKLGSIDELWQHHDGEGIRFNTLYTIKLSNT